MRLNKWSGIWNLKAPQNNGASSLSPSRKTHRRRVYFLWAWGENRWRFNNGLFFLRSAASIEKIKQQQRERKEWSSFTGVALRTNFDVIKHVLLCFALPRAEMQASIFMFTDDLSVLAFAHRLRQNPLSKCRRVLRVLSLSSPPKWISFSLKVYDVTGALSLLLPSCGGAEANGRFDAPAIIPSSLD